VGQYSYGWAFASKPMAFVGMFVIFAAETFGENG
jgi:hypothetical protein